MSNSVDLISTQFEIDKVKSKFDTLNQEIDKQIYTSVMEERLRVNKISISKKIKEPVENAWNAFISMMLQELQTDLTMADLKIDSYFHTKTNKQIFHIIDFEQYKKISILWFSNSQRLIRTIIFKSLQNNTVTKVRYIDLIKGKESVANYLERKALKTYVKKQTVAFKISILKLKLSLSNLTPRKKYLINKKIKKLTK